MLVLCEGQTEREFCRSVVAPRAIQWDVGLCGTIVGKPQRKQGGIREWPVYREELLRLARERPGRLVGVLVDFYGMPLSWPGRAQANRLPSAGRGRHVEDALRADLAGELGDRFIPCVQQHEFESLLFVNPDIAALSLAVAGAPIAQQRISERLRQVRDEFGGRVESINDTPDGAPSKRIQRIVPAYDKVAYGPTIIDGVGLDALRAECPWLDRWLSAIEAAGNADV